MLFEKEKKKNNIDVCNDQENLPRSHVAKSPLRQYSETKD
jgi:hypothetical protein